MSKEVSVREEQNNYLANRVDLTELFAEELEGMKPSFEKIKIPAGGGLGYEVPAEGADSSDIAKEFKAVILYHHPMSVYYKEKYNGASNPPDCSSIDGKQGTDSESEIHDCSSCPYNKFGSGENGAKACKQKRRLFLLREGDVLPILLTLPTGSLSAFQKYIMRVLLTGKKSNSVVTSFTLKKAQNSGGIHYSQASFAQSRALSDEEYENIKNLTAQVKAIATNVDADMDDAE